MPFRSNQGFQPNRRKEGPVFCVGWHVAVNFAAGTAVQATDANGGPVATDLRDGDKVQIVAWRPRPREGTRYHVRRLSDGQECWLHSEALRQT